MSTPTVDLNALLVTKDELAGLATTEDVRAAVEGVRADLGSAVNLVMGEIGKLKAGQEEQSRILARILAKLEGI